MVVVVVSKAVREKLKYALRVPFCIASPKLWGPLGTYVVLKIQVPRPCALQASRQYRLVLGRPRVGIETQKNSL